MNRNVFPYFSASIPALSFCWPPAARMTSISSPCWRRQRHICQKSLTVRKCAFIFSSK